MVTAEGAIMAPGAGVCHVSVAADSMATLSGSACGALVGLDANAMREHQELADALAYFEVYPVVALGLVYRF